MIPTPNPIKFRKSVHFCDSTLYEYLPVQPHLFQSVLFFLGNKAFDFPADWLGGMCTRNKNVNIRKEHAADETKNERFESFY